MTNPIEWQVTLKDNLTIAEFKIIGDVLDVARLSEIDLPPEVRGRENLGLVLSGRGPIWLYCHLAHRAHPFAWVGVNDPRLKSAVVVQRHIPAAPEIGALISLEH